MTSGPSRKLSPRAGAWSALFALVFSAGCGDFPAHQPVYYGPDGGAGVSASNGGFQGGAGTGAGTSSGTDTQNWDYATRPDGPFDPSDSTTWAPPPPDAGDGYSREEGDGAIDGAGNGNGGGGGPKP